MLPWAARKVSSVTASAASDGAEPSRAECAGRKEGFNKILHCFVKHRPEGQGLERVTLTRQAVAQEPHCCGDFAASLVS